MDRAGPDADDLRFQVCGRSLWVVALAPVSRGLPSAVTGWHGKWRAATPSPSPGRLCRLLEAQQPVGGFTRPSLPPSLDGSYIDTSQARTQRVLTARSQPSVRCRTPAGDRRGIRRVVRRALRHLQVRTVPVQGRAGRTDFGAAWPHTRTYLHLVPHRWFCTSESHREPRLFGSVVLRRATARPATPKRPNQARSPIPLRR